ncbi:Dps family protein [Novosphingobium sp. FSW06-99]|uniref:Dps family protein n=1 Tax=Novosphingobium sp. FSW06-99 TaxID=1739113 RepID=UPI00076C85E0|nr:DNA starvation/stationary phase protection protein [Novosphingobium sp. FSW06-99]KUR73356.1 hypothetical protein AQZ49_19910 [Novosphingobium sp. FSW06-99]
MLASHHRPGPDIRAHHIIGTMTGGADEISSALNALLADLFAIYVKTRNFHRHVSGMYCRDYPRLFAEQGDQVLATIDPVAERVRNLGQTTLRSVVHITRLQHAVDNAAMNVTTAEMLAELASDNCRLASSLREIHGLCEYHSDVVTAGSIESWIDEAEGRIWSLTETFE